MVLVADIRIGLMFPTTWVPIATEIAWLFGKIFKVFKGEVTICIVIPDLFGHMFLAMFSTSKEFSILAATVLNVTEGDLGTFEFFNVATFTFKEPITNQSAPRFAFGVGEFDGC